MTMTTTKTDVQTLEAQHVLQNYRRQPVVFERGEGMRLFDDRGRAYLDFLSGIGVASLGHGHPALARALAEQAKTLIHTSNLYFHPLQGELAARLSTLTGLERAFFCNSGTEAVEACLKFARRYWHTRGAGRPKFVAFVHSFHGRTMGALSVTSDEHYRIPFEPLIHDVVFADAADPASISRLVDASTAAVIVEPIQGEGGVRMMSREAAAAITAAARRTGALIIADEVQSGSGRTGSFLAASSIGLQPDLVALGKALGAGVPIGATMCSAEVATAIVPGDHGTTYGGNLLACRAALCFLDELVDGGLIAQVGRVGRHVEERLRAIAASHAIVREVRGQGLMWGLDLTIDAAPVVPAGLARGVIVNRTAETVVRLLPPFVITEADADEGLDRLAAALDDVAHGRNT